MSNRRPRLAHLLAAALCLVSLTAVASTYVGNPKFLPGLLDVPPAVDMPLADLELDDCQGNVTTLQTRMDLTDPSSVLLPSGSWCAITVVFDDAIVVD